MWINEEVFQKIKIIVLKKIREKFPEANFHHTKVYGLCSVISETINWQESVIQLFLHEVFDKLRTFYFIRDNGIPYGLDDYHKTCHPDKFEQDSKEILEVLEDCSDIVNFLLTRCLQSFNGRPIDEYPELIGKS